MPTVFLFLLLVATADADQLRFSSVRDWRDWQVPVGAVKIAPTGAIQPLRVQKGVDAVRDATALGGGIRRAGSNPRNAAALLDGNPATGWAPNPDDVPRGLVRGNRPRPQRLSAQYRAHLRRRRTTV